MKAVILFVRILCHSNISPATLREGYDQSFFQDHDFAKQLMKALATNLIKEWEKKIEIVPSGFPNNIGGI